MRLPSVALAALGLKLPPVSAPKGSYTPAVQAGRLVYAAGQIPLTDGRLTATGKVGAEVDPEQARRLSRQCALASLAAAADVAGGLDRVAGVVKVTGYVTSAEGFTGQLAVVAGTTEFFAEVFGDAGTPVCSAVGMADGPLTAPVEIEAVFAVGGAAAEGFAAEGIAAAD